MAPAVGAAVVAFFSASAAAAITAMGAIGTMIYGVIGGAIIGAAIGGLSAAITGGDIGKGMLYGAIAGAVTGGYAGYTSGVTSMASTASAASAEWGGTHVAHMGGQAAVNTSAANAASTSLFSTTASGATTSKGISTGDVVGTAADTINSEAGSELLGGALKGYYADKSADKATAAAALEKQKDRDWQSSRDALQREHEQTMTKLSGSGNSGHLQYKLGMSQLDENIRQFDVQRKDYLLARSEAKGALSGFRIKKADTSKRAFQTTSENPNAGGTSSALGNADGNVNEDNTALA